MKRNIIPRIAPTWQRENWQKAMAQSIRDPASLLQQLELPVDLLPAAIQAAQQFPLRVPLSYLARMEKGNPNDPLLRQVLPLQAELQEHPDFVSDPVGDLNATAVPGLLHKYEGRALLITTGACAVHCRYCFRRHYPYQQGSISSGQLDEVLTYLAQDTSITELILSGGDPLSLSNERLHSLQQRIGTIPHIKRLRLHTRLPVVLPERIDSGFLDWIAQCPQQLVMVIHCNHPQEIDSDVASALQSLQQLGVTLLNQAVLLRGINDELACQQQLSERLFEVGVLPYYLHQLDRVMGAQHFEVSDAHAIALHTALRHHLPGYLVPRLVREIAGKAAKTPVPR